MEKWRKETTKKRTKINRIEIVDCLLVSGVGIGCNVNKIYMKPKQINGDSFDCMVTEYCSVHMLGVMPWLSPSNTRWLFYYITVDPRAFATPTYTYPYSPTHGTRNGDFNSWTFRDARQCCFVTNTHTHPIFSHIWFHRVAKTTMFFHLFKLIA